MQPGPDRTLPDLFAVPGLIRAMLLLLLVLPVWLPVAVLFGRTERRRLRAAAAATRCGSCGARLGLQAPELSDAAHRATLAAAQRRCPTHRVHVRRQAQARCPACGADYVWDAKRRVLDRLPDAADPASPAVGGDPLASSNGAAARAEWRPWRDGLRRYR